MSENLMNALRQTEQEYNCSGEVKPVDSFMDWTK